MTFYDVETFEKKDICAVELVNRKLVIEMKSQMLQIEGENLDAVKGMLEIALKK